MGYKEANVYSLIYTFYEGRSLGGRIEYSNKDADALHLAALGLVAGNKSFHFFFKCTKLKKPVFSF